MLQDQQLSSRDLILDTAEQLFVEKGYRGVRLKNVAELVGIRQASLYYHFPGGKRELYAEVMRRSFARKQAGIREAIRQAGSHWRDQLDGATRWLLSQTLYDYRRMVQSDLPELAREDADRLAQEAYTALHQPIEEVFALGSQQEGLLLPQRGMMSGSFIAIIDGILTIPDFALSRTRLDLAREMIEILLNGLRPRE
ncbi:MAG: TetR/AcrR family transcriptional regulator [Alkalispirochaetaceae bacterium]